MDSSTDPQTGLITLVCIRDITDSRLNVVALAGESRTVSQERAARLVATGCFATVPQAGVPPALPEKSTARRAKAKARRTNPDELTEDPLRQLTGGSTFLG